MKKYNIHNTITYTELLEEKKKQQRKEAIILFIKSILCFIIIYGFLWLLSIGLSLLEY